MDKSLAKFKSLNKYIKKIHWPAPTNYVFIWTINEFVQSRKIKRKPRQIRDVSPLI